MCCTNPWGRMLTLHSKATKQLHRFPPPPPIPHFHFCLPNPKVLGDTPWNLQDEEKVAGETPHGASPMVHLT